MPIGLYTFDIYNKDVTISIPDKPKSDKEKEGSNHSTINSGKSKANPTPKSMI